MALPLRDDGPTRRVPWMTFLLLGVNVLVFLFLQPATLQQRSGDGGLGAGHQAEINSYFYRWGAVPCEIQHLKPLATGIACDGKVEAGATLAADKVVLVSFITALFIHGSLLHLGGNMLFLYVFGRHVEDRLGPVPFLLLYLVTGVIATMGHALFHWSDAVPVLGASGAIAGVMGAYLVFRPRGRVLALVFWTVVYVPAWVLLGLFFVTQFLTPDSEGVAWVAHAAGMSAGVIFALILARIFRDPSAPVRIPGPPSTTVDWVLPTGPPPTGS